MFKIQYKGVYEYIPFQYNQCVHGSKDFRDSFLNSNYLKLELQEFVNKKIYIWDMRYLTDGDERVLEEVVEEVAKRGLRIILFGVNKGNIFRKAIGFCKNKYGTIIQYIEEKDMCLLGGITKESLSELAIDDILQEYLQTYMKKYTEEKFGYLVSSGIYSDKEINYKKMFYDPQNTSYTIYLLFQKIQEVAPKHDYLVATSKNGVALATILGELLNLEVVYLNIGQMFEERYNVKPPIKEGKSYLHIYDVICSGSETKIASALVEAYGGKIDCSVGIMCLLDLEAAKKHNNYSALKNVKCLMELKNTDIEYGIYLKDNKGE